MDEIDFSGVNLEEAWEEQAFKEKILHAERAASDLLGILTDAGLADDVIRKEKDLSCVILSALSKTLASALLKFAEEDAEKPAEGRSEAGVGYQNGILACLVLTAALRKKLQSY